MKIWEPPGLEMAPCSKGNTYEIITVNGKSRLRHTDEAKAFINAGILWWKSHRPNPAFGLDDKLALCVMVQYPDYRKDPDLELVADCLQKAGVYPNDRQCRDKRIIALDETGPPMTWVQVELIGKLPWKSRTKR